MYFRTSKNYKDENLKTELAQRLMDEYPVLTNDIVQRNEVRDRIIDIVKREDQKTPKMLTVIDVKTSPVFLNDLHTSIFSIYLQCKIFFFISFIHFLY